MFGIEKSFSKLRRRNKVLFAIIIAFSIVMFWKGSWGLLTIVFDEWLFRNHIFWSNVAATVVSLAILSGAGLIIDRLV